LNQPSRIKRDQTVHRRGTFRRQMDKIDQQRDARFQPTKESAINIRWSMRPFRGERDLRLAGAKLEAPQENLRGT
jgi:hypothetical protein